MAIDLFLERAMDQLINDGDQCSIRVAEFERDFVAWDDF
jgi:hypothetical protein